MPCLTVRSPALAAITPPSTLGPWRIGTTCLFTSWDAKGHPHLVTRRKHSDFEWRIHLRGVVDTLEGWAAIQRDHHRLEKQAAVNVTQFRDRKCKPDQISHLSCFEQGVCSDDLPKSLLNKAVR